MSGFEPTESSIGKSRPEETSVLLNLMPHILDTLKREPALAITIGYLLVAMAGIFYNIAFYQKFGIPVLMLSQINDFLVAGVQEPMALLLVFSTFPLCWLFDRINTRVRRSRIEKLERLRQTPNPSFLRRSYIGLLSWWIGHRWYMGAIYLIVVAAYGWIFVTFYADHRADIVKSGRAPHVTVWLQGEANPLSSQSRSWTYLGAVSNYVFVYDHLAQRAEILPVNNIARLEPVSAKSTPDSVPIL